MSNQTKIVNVLDFLKYRVHQRVGMKQWWQIPVSESVCCSEWSEP